MGFSIVVDNKKVYFDEGNKIVATLPKTLFFNTEEKWEICLLSVWTNRRYFDPCYIGCSILERQIVGDKWEKNLAVVIRNDNEKGYFIKATHVFYKKIFDPHVSTIIFSFENARGEPIIFDSDAHIILQLHVKKRE